MHAYRSDAPQGSFSILSVRPILTRLLLGTWGAWIVLAMAQEAAAQAPVRREYPPDGYYLAMRLYERGEFVDAGKAFRTLAGAGLRTTEGGVDSICYAVMMGECYYQLGDLGRALEQYTNALNVFLAYPNWTLRIDYPPGVEPLLTTMTKPITWGVPTRRTTIGRFADKYPVLQGRLDNAEVLRRGGVIALPEFALVNVHEIIRCTALAQRRRRELLGVTGTQDPLTAALGDTLGRRGPLNHWSQPWSDVLTGLAYAGQGKSAQAIVELQKSLMIAGQFDHPLTATALIELGKLHFDEQKYEVAATYFMEATYVAAWFSQINEMEEAFRLATTTYLVGGARGTFAPLEPAVAWSRRTSRLLEVSLLACAAQNAAEVGNATAALGLMEQAGRAAVRTNLLAGGVGARLSYAAALAHYQLDNVTLGDKAFNDLMVFQRRGSRRLFELGLVHQLATAGSSAVPERIAKEWYGHVLREPTAKDWLLDPVDTLSVVLAAPLAPLEQWFELAFNGTDTDSGRPYEISDKIRRQRFLSSLPMAGRQLAFRWVLEAPPELLSDAARLQRQDILARYPAFVELARRSAALRQSLRAMPLVPETDDVRRRQATLLAELGTVSQQQERLIRDMALRRIPCEFAFPPVRSFKEIQSSLPEDALVLSFLETTRAVYALGCSRDSYSQWRLQTPAQVRRDISQLLAQLGLVDRNAVVDPALLRDEAWKETAAKLLSQLTDNAKSDVWNRFHELTIVPDGVLWYVPFEALQVVEEGVSTPLIGKLRIRYAPTLSLAPPDPRGVNALADTAVVAGRLYPRDDTLTEDALAAMRKVSDRIATLPSPLPAPSNLLGALCNRLVVLADFDQPARGPYDWSPMQIDTGKTIGTLASWLLLPWDGPQQVVLPGFHTPAEIALRKGGTGEEVFLAVCGLMASGSRTVLLSRWRTGGDSSLHLVREFIQELPYSSAADAWQRSVQLAMERDLVVDREPRVKPGDLEASIKTNHPFFWSGYLLVDTGARPADESAKPVAEAPPAIEKPAKTPPTPDEPTAPTEKPATKMDEPDAKMEDADAKPEKADAALGETETPAAEIEKSDGDPGSG